MKFPYPIGTDPEAFFAIGRHIIGSEKVIPADGLEGQRGKVIRDGIQVEFNPLSGSSLEELSDNLKTTFRYLQDFLNEGGNPDGVKLSFEPVVKISQKELRSLSPESRRFGCSPSFNIYGPKQVGVDGTKYQFRSAGGHLHFSLPKTLWNHKNIDHRAELVSIFEPLVGIASVLLDRSEGQVERRKHYGRAGEYRLPRYGVEYRTPSNFWLKDLQLMQYMFGLGAYAIELLSKSKYGHTGIVELQAGINYSEIQEIIDTSDVEGADDVWTKAVSPLVARYPSRYFKLSDVAAISMLSAEIVGDGIDEVFPTDPFTYWCERV